MLAGDVAQVLGVQQSIPGAAQELGTGVAQVDLNAAGGARGRVKPPPLKPFGIFHPPPPKTLWGLPQGGSTPPPPPQNPP